MEYVIRKIFPNGLKKDWMDSIYRVYDSYSAELTLPVYKRVLKSVSNNQSGIKKFEKYLEKAVENELSSKQTPMYESTFQKKYIREEMVPDWLKNRDVDEPEETEPQLSEEERNARNLELLKLFEKSSA